jgi:hypothetical protein
MIEAGHVECMGHLINVYNVSVNFNGTGNLRELGLYGRTALD